MSDRLRHICGFLALVASFVFVGFSDTAECLEPRSRYTQYLSQHWTMSNGFPGGRINAITQTPDGYLWIGTSKGLVRFDNFSFTSVGHSTYLTTPVSQALSLVAANDGDLWVWDQDMNARRYTHGKFDDAKSLAGGQDSVVSAIARSTGGDVLVATQAPSLFRYSHGRSEALTGPHNLDIPSPQTVAETTDGKIWMATYEAGLFYWDRNRVTTLKEDIPDKINCLVPVENGGLWIGTDDGVIFWDGNKVAARISNQSFAGAHVLSLAEDRDKNLWLGTSKGLFRRNSEGLKPMGNAGQQTDRTVTAIFEDKEGNLWIGGSQGIERLRNGSFKSVSIEGRPASDVASAGPIYADSSGRVWIAPSGGGLSCVINGETIQKASGDLGRDVIYSVTGFRDDLWVGRRDGGLTHLVQRGVAGPSVHTVRTYTHSQGLAQNSVSSVFRSVDGTIWAGTLSGGVSHLQNNHFSTLTSADGLGSNTISSIQEDRNGAMWFGTSDGLSQLADGKMKTFRVRDGLPSDEITTLLADSSGVLWVGTSQGITYISLGQIHPILDARPALHEPIFGIAEDRNGSLWMTSSNHVFRVNRNALMKESINDADYREFSESDGLLGTEGVRRDRSTTVDAQGRIWLSTLGGLSLVRTISQNAVPALPHIESVSSDGNQLDPFGAVRIDPKPQRITITYEAVSLAVPNKVRYRYKLQGFDRVWSEPTDSRQVVYTNLGPGSYQFGVQVSNGDDSWKGSDTLLPFTIQPAVWQTWWFRLLWIVAALVLLLTSYRVRVHSIARAMSVRFDERMVERTRMARDLHDTFLQTVQASKMVADDALATGTDEVRMRNSMEKLSRWLGQAVTEGRTALHALRVSKTENNEFAESLDRMLTEQCQNSSIAASFFITGEPKALHPIVREELSLIAGEAIRNARAHSKASRLTVELHYANELRLRVKDDGVGIDRNVLQSGKAQHFGIQGMRERSAMLRAKIAISSAPETGTEVTLKIPGDVAYKHGRQSVIARFVATYMSQHASRDRDEKNGH